MYFIFERLGKIISELKELRCEKKISDLKVYIKDGYFDDLAFAEDCKEPWREFSPKTLWGGKDQYVFFKLNFTVLEALKGKKIMLDIKTGNEGQWDANVCQFILYVNGEIKQGIDINHTMTCLTKSAKVNENYEIGLQAYSGMIDQLSRFLPSIIVWNDLVEKVYFDLLVPYQTIEMLDKDDKKRIDTLNILEKAINLIDLRIPYSEAFINSIKKASDYLDNVFYGQFCKRDDLTVHCIGHTHIDVAWLWDLDQTRKKVARSFSTVLDLMDEYDDYLFMSSQPQLYKFLKEDYPKLFNRVKKRIEEGRFEPEGAMWVEADCNLSSGESLVRQIIHGKRFFRDNFGKENRVLWLPDVFGYCAQLPQILKKSGIDYFMTTKISWNEYNKLPCDTFKWYGLDGSNVLAHFITTMDYASLRENRYTTTYNGMIQPNEIKGAWERYQQKDINNDVLVSFGYGDGGGGPTREMLETHKRLEKGIARCPKTKMTKALDFFELLESNVEDKKRLPSWVGELYFEYHRGTLTSMARNKRYNRKSEFLYEDLEWFATMDAYLNNTKYPEKMIESGWEIILLNQFHDIIPGSSIKKVYEDSKEQYEEIIKEGSCEIERIIDNITSKIKVNEPSVVIFNPTSFERDEWIEFENESKKYAFYARGIPSKGYMTYPISQIKEAKGSCKITKHHMENNYFSIDFDDNGDITSIFDKRESREVLKENMKGNVFEAFEDKPHNWDAWDINIYYQEKQYAMDSCDEMEIVEAGTKKATLKIVKRFSKSVITQFVSIYDDIARIDFDTTVDWKEKQILLKAAFNLDIHAEKATYDVQFGNLERPTHNNTSWDVAKFEVCGHKWADVSEDGYGVSIINDCKYGHDIKDSKMRLTLIKSSVSPNEDADREIHKFKYSLYPHIGDYKEAKTNKMAYYFNQDVYVRTIEKQDGELDNSYSFAKVEDDNVVMEVVKKAYDDEGFVLRVYESNHRRTSTSISLAIPVEHVYECDLEERKTLREIPVKGNSFSFEINPFEVKTFKIK